MAIRSVSLILVALAISANSQQCANTCGCAQQQPVIVQMSCGGAPPQLPPTPPQQSCPVAPNPAPAGPAPAPAPPAPTPAPDPENPITCYEDNDLLITIDESGSVGEHDYRISLDFAAKLAQAWKAHPGNRVAVILFSHVARTLITFAQGDALSGQEMHDQIIGATYDSGGTSIDLALDACREEITNGARTGVKRNVVFLTDGQSNEFTTDQAATQLYSLPDVYGYSVGVGQYTNHVELLAIAQKQPDHMFASSDYDALIKLLGPVSEKVCEDTSGGTAPAAAPAPAPAGAPAPAPAPASAPMPAGK